MEPPHPLLLSLVMKMRNRWNLLAPSLRKRLNQGLAKSLNIISTLCNNNQVKCRTSALHHNQNVRKEKSLIHFRPYFLAKSLKCSFWRKSKYLSKLVPAHFWQKHSSVGNNEPKGNGPFGAFFNETKNLWRGLIRWSRDRLRYIGYLVKEWASFLSFLPAKARIPANVGNTIYESIHLQISRKSYRQGECLGKPKLLVELPNQLQKGSRMTCESLENPILLSENLDEKSMCYLYAEPEFEDLAAQPYLIPSQNTSSLDSNTLQLQPLSVSLRDFNIPKVILETT
ncbi:Ras and Rab interactor 2 [Striga asiatica]|uniref:Ras and Rab interactor 2 n=1 Tax=Striga asiatica TaxID=4170 RepID=A0A5A7PKL4_STRAF|nr:Ras and Rab interactor 2 [Striga asiatica]